MPGLRKSRVKPRPRRSSSVSRAADARVSASRVSISRRKSKVTVSDFSPGYAASLKCGEIHRLFPDVLAGREFRKLVGAASEVIILQPGGSVEI